MAVKLHPGDRVVLAAKVKPISAYYSGYSNCWAISNFDHTKVGIVAAIDVPPVRGKGKYILVDYCDAEMTPEFAKPNTCSVGMRRVAVRRSEIRLAMPQ